MRTILLGLMLAMSFSSFAIARDTPPEVLQRTGKWVVDYDRDSCHLFAQFGDGDNMIALKFTRYELGDSFALSVFGKRLGSASPRTSGTIDFGLKDKPVDIGIISGSAGQYRAYFVSTTRIDGWQWAEGDTPPKVAPAQEAAVTGVTLAVRGRKPLRFEFGPIDKPMAQLHACQDSLVKSWGFDPTVQAALQRPARPAGSPGAWLRGEDYPMESVRQGHNGLVQFRVDVDAQGKVGGCYVLDRTSPDDFADVTCSAVLRRASFTPALDAEGRPVRSYYVAKVQWQMPG